MEQVQEQFEREGPWDMAQLESGLCEALLKDGCHILEALLNQPGALGACKPDARVHLQRTRRVQSVLGCFELRRGYYPQGAQRWFPMDRHLGLHDRYTPGRTGKQPDRSAVTREVKLGCLFTCRGLDEVFAEAYRNLPHHGPRRQSADREVNDFRTHASRIP